MATDPARSATDLVWLTERPIAHRGFHAVGGVGDGPENTYLAFEAAMAAGHAIELDVQLAADGEVVVFHDATLDRLTAETGPVLTRTSHELCHVAVGADNIPALADVLRSVNDVVPIVVEVKAEHLDDANAQRLTERAAAWVRHYPGRATLMSFDHRVLRHASEWAQPCGLVAEGRSESDFAWHGTIADLAAFLSYRVDDLPNPFVTAFRASGRPVITWTVRTPVQVALTQAHADQMTFEGFDPNVPSEAHG